MSTISLSLPADGQTIDASDVNTPFNTIATAINGNLDNTNIVAGAAIDGGKIATGVQADLEAQTSNKIVDASNIKWSPVAIKAWTQGKYTTGTPSSAGTPYGITSYTDTGTGDVTINLSVTFSDVSNMCIVASAFTNSDAVKLFAAVRAFSTTTARIQFWSDAGALTDPVGFMVMITGDLA